MTSCIYEPLDFGQHEIRLVSLHPSLVPGSEIRCTLFNASLNDAPEYRALSYVWGDLKLTSPIWVNGDKLEVTGNLLAALNFLRFERSSLTLWIDAICIDQSNIHEKNEQVRRMRDVFEQALEVFVWLGEEKDDSDLAMNLIETWGMQRLLHKFAEEEIPSTVMEENMDEDDAVELVNTIEALRPKANEWNHGPTKWLEAISNPFDPKAWEALRHLFQREWWRRIWVYQEVVVAKTATLVCGANRVDWVLLFWARVAWQEISDPKLFLSEPLEFDAIQRILESGHRVAEWICYHRKSWSNEHFAELFDLQMLLGHTRRFKSTDPRDKIYALLGVDKIKAITIAPDYDKPFAQVYSELVHALIQSQRDLSPLCRLGAGIGYSVEASKDLPSWVADLRVPDRSAPFSSKPFCASEETEAIVNFSADVRVLETRGAIFDEIREINILGNSTDQIRKQWQHVLLHQKLRVHPTGIPQIQAFFRTLITDNSGFGYGRAEFRDEGRANEFFDLAAGFMWCMGKDTNGSEESQRRMTQLHAFNDYVQRFTQWTGEVPSSLSERHLLEPFLGSKGSETQLQWPLITDRRKGYKCSLSFLLEEGLNCRNMSLFITRKGYLGLAPPGTQKGDIICVLLGCDKPLVIRKIEGLYFLVGCCYCYGIMNGEVLQDIRAGKLYMENIKLR